MENLIFNIRPTLLALRKGYKANNFKHFEKTQPINIKTNTSSKVRLNLKWDDIINDTLLVQGVVNELFFKRKKIYLFREPYYVPDFRQYFAKKVESPDNWYLEELILGLLFLNPKPDHLMKQKITGCILLKFTEHHKVESKVKPGQFVYVPVLNFEEILVLVSFMANSKLLKKHYNPTRFETVMYGNNYLDKGEKIAFRSALRMHGAKIYYKKAINEAIKVLIENNPDVKISFAQLESIRIIKKFNTNEYATAKLIRSVITYRNNRIIAKHNAKAKFSNVTKKEKYKKFCLMDSPTLDEVVKHCQISRRDAMVFRKLIKEQTN